MGNSDFLLGNKTSAEYEGEKKHGKGTMFDSTAGKSRSGEWKDDKPYGRQVIVNY